MFFKILLLKTLVLLYIRVLKKLNIKIKYLLFLRVRSLVKVLVRKDIRNFL